MSPSVSIPSRFNGPLDSGNGGYCAGVVASFVEGGQPEVSLRRPVPLERELNVVGGSDGDVQVLDGDELIVEASPGDQIDVRVPPPVSVPDGRAAMQHYRGLDVGPFCKCFVCGLAREDSYRVFAGRVEDRDDVVASVWRPPPDSVGSDGNVRPELIWAVLDCPTYFATYIDQELALSFLARFAVRIDGPVSADEEHVVIAWPIGVDGRKRRAGAAVLDAQGRTLAVADALLIEPRA